MWWNIVALVTGIICMGAGTFALYSGAIGIAIGLLVAGFVLLLLAGTWTYIADLVFAFA